LNPAQACASALCEQIRRSWLVCRLRGAPQAVALQHSRARARSNARECIGALTSVARIGHTPGQAEAFTAVPTHGMMLRSGPALSKGVRAPVAARPARAAVALRMQSEDDKAKASGVALALIGFVASGFSVFFAVLAGGLGIYAGKSPVCAQHLHAPRFPAPTLAWNARSAHELLRCTTLTLAGCVRVAGPVDLDPCMHLASDSS